MCSIHREETMRIRIKRKRASKGARALSTELRARGLNSRLLRTENSRYVQRASDLLINWGQTSLEGLNQNARRACDKLMCLQALEAANITTPEFTTDMETAKGWTEDGAVCCRTSLQGSGGNDIEIVTRPEDVVAAPLYTRYVKKKDEYRVHIFDGDVIDMQRKARRSSVEDEDVDWQIRSYANGFCFVRENVSLPDNCLAMCLEAIKELGLDFGAIDVIYNEHRDKYYILEINTAPGLEGQTIVSYADAIEKYIGEHNEEV